MTNIWTIILNLMDLHQVKNFFSYLWSLELNQSINLLIKVYCKCQREFNY